MTRAAATTAAAVRQAAGREDRAAALRPGGPPGRRAPAWLSATVIGLAGLAGFALFLAPLGGVRLTAMNGLGLISVLPAWSLAGLCLLVASFAALLARRRPARTLLVAFLVALTFCLDGVTGLVEPLPRFATTYQVAGFVGYILHTGHVTPSLTAYFSWPGFLALIAFAAKAAGAHSLLGLMTWWPFIIDVLLLPPFLLLTSALRVNWRARWLAALLFCLGNWVGQDYFSPQSFNFLLYLTFTAILLIWFGGQRARPPRRRAAAGRVRGELPARQVTTGQRAALLTTLIGIFALSVLSHQLTPFVLLATCACLVLVGRATPRGLPVLLAVILIAWVSYGTVAYWSGHLSTIFGDVGTLGSNFSSSVSNRVIGTRIHRLVDYSRIGLAGLMAAMAVLGLVRRRLRGLSDRALAVLLIAPVSLVALQNYGGEISLRVYLFALPAAALLTASLFFPEPKVRAAAANGEPVNVLAGVPRANGASTAGSARTAKQAGQRGRAAGPTPIGAALTASPAWQAGQAVLANPVLANPVLADTGGQPDLALPRARASAWSVVTAGVLALALSGLFLVARYGNEAFERIPLGEYQAMNYIYDHAGRHASVLWLSRPAGLNATPQMPWQFRDIDKVEFVSISAPKDPSDTARVAAYLRHLGPHTYLITTTTEATFIAQTASFRTDWERAFRRAMNSTPGVTLVRSNRVAAVYQASHPAKVSQPAAHPQAAAQSGSTPWSPLGLIALAEALLLLGAREFIRVCAPARRALMQPLAFAAIAPVIVALIAVAERFRVLA